MNGRAIRSMVAMSTIAIVNRKASNALMPKVQATIQMTRPTVRVTKMDTAREVIERGGLRPSA